MYKEYKLIISTDSDSFGTKVSSYLKKGWRPYGNPFTTRSGWCQAILLPMEIITDTETKKSCGGNCSCKKEQK